MTVPERKSYRLAYLTLGACAVILVIVAVGLLVSYKGTDASQEVAQSQRRQDCARQISFEQNQVRDAATVADRAITRFYQRALLNSALGVQPNQADIAEYARLLDQADKADTNVTKLPDLQDEVERRCPG